MISLVWWGWPIKGWRKKIFCNTWVTYEGCSVVSVLWLGLLTYIYTSHKSSIVHYGNHKSSLWKSKIIWNWRLQKIVQRYLAPDLSFRRCKEIPEVNEIVTLDWNLSPKLVDFSTWLVEKNMTVEKFWSRILSHITICMNVFTLGK